LYKIRKIMEQERYKIRLISNTNGEGGCMMKKVLSVVVALAIMMLTFALAENGEEVWWEMTENVLTVRVPVSEGENWEYMISDPEMLELLTQETDGDMYVASFTNFAPEEDEVTLALICGNEAGTPWQVRRLTLEMNQDGVFTVAEQFVGNLDEDFGLFYNPLGYELMKVNNVCMADAETLCVEGAFGTFEEMEEGGLQELGFDRKYTISLAEECQILVPATMEDLSENVEVEDLQAWYEDACQLLGFQYAFCVQADMNENGQVVRLEYVYIP